MSGPREAAKGKDLPLVHGGIKARERVDAWLGHGLPLPGSVIGAMRLRIPPTFGLFL